MKKINNIFEVALITSVLGVLVLLFVPMFNTDTTNGYDFMKLLSDLPEIDTLTVDLVKSVLALHGFIIAVTIFHMFNEKIKPSKNKFTKYLRNNLEAILIIAVALLVITYFTLVIVNNMNFSHEDNIKFAENVYLTYGFYLYALLLFVVPGFSIYKSTKK